MTPACVCCVQGPGHDSSSKGGSAGIGTGRGATSNTPAQKAPLPHTLTQPVPGATGSCEDTTAVAQPTQLRVPVAVAAAQQQQPSPPAVAACTGSGQPPPPASAAVLSASARLAAAAAPASQPVAAAAAGGAAGSDVGAATAAATTPGSAQEPASAEPGILPVGLKLHLNLQELQLCGERMGPVTSIGTVDAEVVQLAGEGGNALAILCSLSNYQPQAASSSPAPWGAATEPKVVLKLPRKPDVLTAEEQKFFQEAHSVSLWREHELLRKPQLQKCKYVIDTYGFCAARAADKRLLCGFEWLPCVMLEWAEEGSLWQQVKPPNGPPAPLGVMGCRLVLSQLLFAVKAVHDAGYVHRDIKPHNILKAKPSSGRSTIYKLCDFGTALPRSQPKANERKEGTPAYIPPEQYWQASSDTWHIGKCMLALRSGAAPHKGTFEEVRDSGQYNSLEERMEEAEWGFLQKCLQANSGDRPDPLMLLSSKAYPIGM